MAIQSIPISLTASPIPTSIKVTTPTELLALFTQYVSGSISADVSFFLSGSTPPDTDEGVIFYSTTLGLFMAWSTAAGQYVPTGLNLRVGDTLMNFTAGDEISRGYFVCDGRTIATIPGISPNQATALATYFGTPTLPTVTAPASVGATLLVKVFGEFPQT